jgi:hypothetical protein
VASMDKRISAAKRQLDRHLQQLLLESLAADDWGPALHCLHGHVELGDPGRGEEALRSGLVRGVVREVVQEAKAAAGTGANRVLWVVDRRSQACPLGVCLSCNWSCISRVGGRRRSASCCHTVLRPPSHVGGRFSSQAPNCIIPCSAPC